MKIRFPPVYEIEELVAENPVLQIKKEGFELEGTASPFAKGKLRGIEFRSSDGGEPILIIPKAVALSEYGKIVRGEPDISADNLDLLDAQWVKHPLLLARIPINYEEKLKAIRATWVGAFSFVGENQEKGLTGLRPPQLGALHAIHAHWFASADPATVVMPTGTGKTDTMISILVSAMCEKVLVIVPTDVLRYQLAAKFMSLGVLKKTGPPLLKEEADYPVVAMLQHIPQSIEVADELLSKAQVIISTSSILSQCNDDVKDEIAKHCSHLFIDEAHHAEAPTWNRLKKAFKARRIVQFTATPFREDGRPLDGKIIFNYPLRKAQEENYFKPINFVPVVEFNLARSDEAIVKKAIQQLKEDYGKGHILMARVATVARAKQIFPLYAKYEEFNPVQLHTGIPAKKRAEIRKSILSGSVRVIVCVDMLGEGFDLPELKIAAFHDIRKTLGTINHLTQAQ